MKRAIFLDRDGVLNQPVLRNGRPYPPANIEELKLFPDVAGALQRLKKAGFLLVVVTNQPDVARGTQTREGVEDINAALGATLPIDGFFVCWHDDADACTCRKPKAGLLLEAAATRHIDLERSFMVGDRWRDIDAGAAAGCTTVLLDRNYSERAPRHPPAFRARSLAAATDWILSTVIEQPTRP
jgi:D-glycero-D-manno-heptose 1,7-bisphosphate phosphatase